MTMMTLCVTRVRPLTSELLVIGRVNEAVIRGDSQQLLSALLLPSCGVEEILAANACRYLKLLSRARQHRAQVSTRRRPITGGLLAEAHILHTILSNQVSRDPGAELWLADIQEGVTRANQETQRALKCEAKINDQSDQLSRNVERTL